MCPLTQFLAGSKQQAIALTPNWGEIAARRSPRLTPLARPQLPASGDRGDGWLSELQAECLVLRVPDSVTLWDRTAKGSGLPVPT